MPENQLSLLEAIMVEEGDLELFPKEVVDLYESGKGGPLLARKRMLGLVDTANPSRAAKQREYLDKLRLWAAREVSAPSMYTLNGIGTMLYGVHDKRPDDQTYISTLYLVVLFIPLVPIESYWVKDGDGRNYYFYGKTAHPPSVRTLMGLVWGCIGVLALLFAVASFMDSERFEQARVGAWNGFDREVVLTIAGVDYPCAANTGRTLLLDKEDVLAEARFNGDSDPFETVELKLAGRHVPTIYNIGGRDLLTIDYIVYGDSEIPDSDLLTEKVSYPPDVDHLFREPPKEKSHRSIDTVLLPEPWDDRRAVMVLGMNGHPEAAATLAASALRDGVSDMAFLQIAAAFVLQAGETDIAGLCEEMLETHPNEVDRHRFCQESSGEEKSEMIGRYRALAEIHPDSAMYAYLCGRLLPDDEGVPWFERALALDPTYARAHLAIGYQTLTGMGSPKEALASYLRALELEPTLGDMARSSILIAGQLTGRSGDQLIAEQPPEDAVFRMGDMLRLQAAPQGLAAELQRLDREGAEWDPAQLANVKANAALAAGDLDQLRVFSSQGGGLTLHLALSAGAVAAEQVELPEELYEPDQKILAWYADLRAGRATDARLEAVRAAFPKIAALLERGAFTEDAVREALRFADPVVHAPVWYIAYRETGVRAFGITAKKWAQPTQLPIFTP